MDTGTSPSAVPVEPDACLTHRKGCARPSVERFTDDDLRHFRRFCGALLGRLLEDGDSRRVLVAGPAPRNNRS